MFKKNLIEINNQDKITNKTEKKKLMTEQRTMTEVMTEEMTEEMNLITKIHKDQEVSLKLNQVKTKTKIKIKVSKVKKKDTMKIIDFNLKGIIITSKRIFKQTHKISLIITSLLDKKSISMTFITKSKPNFQNTALLELKLLGLKLSEPFNQLKIFREISQILKESTFLELLKYKPHTHQSQTKQVSSNSLNSQKKPLF